MSERWQQKTSVGAWVLGLSAVLWWLFADTYARHFPTGRDRPAIRFAHFGGHEEFSLFRDAIEEFENENPHIEVAQEYVVGLAGHYNTKMRQQILSSTLPDVALIQLGPFHELAQNFADLTELQDRSSNPSPKLTELLDPVGLNAFKFQGRQRALPLSGGSLLIYCNTKAFARAAAHRGEEIALPDKDWTIDQFRRLAGKLTCDFDDDGLIDQFGFWQPRWVYYLPFLWSFGAELTDETYTTWKLLGPEAEQALAFYRDLAVGERVSPREDEVPQLFQDVGFLTGQVAMCITGPWFQPFLSETALADSYVVVEIPKGPAGRVTRVTWDGIVMANNLPPERRRAAERFIQHLLSPAVQERIAETGRALPARRESLAAFSRSSSAARRNRFVEALAYSRTQPLIPGFGAVDRAINRHLNRLLTSPDTISVATVLRDLARDPAVRSRFIVNGLDPR